MIRRIVPLASGFFQRVPARRMPVSATNRIDDAGVATLVAMRTPDRVVMLRVFQRDRINHKTRLRRIAPVLIQRGIFVAPAGLF